MREAGHVAERTSLVHDEMGGDGDDGLAGIHQGCDERHCTDAALNVGLVGHDVVRVEGDSFSMELRELVENAVKRVFIVVW